MNCLNCEPIGILQKDRYIPYALRYVEIDDAIAFPGIHIDDRKSKSFPHFRIEKQTTVVHRVAKYGVKGIVIDSGTALVGRHYQKGFRRTLLAVGISYKLDLSDAGSCPTHVS